MRIEMMHPSAGKVALVGSPIRMSKTPPSYRRPPPSLGGDTRDLLARLLGKDNALLDALHDKGVI